MPSILKVAEATLEMKGVEFALLSSSDGSAMTGQAGSTTVRLRLNGVEAAGTGTVVELDATNRPGLYAYRLATAELANEAFGLMRPVCSGAVAADYPFWVTPNDPLGEALDTTAIDATISANTKVVAIETKVTTLPANVEQTLAGHENRLIDIEADTVDLQARVPATLVGGRIDADVSASLATYDPPTKAELDAGLAALNDPTAAEVASAVRTELGTELGRIDVAVSTRSTLSAAGVRSELTTELGRIDATVSSRATPAQVNAEVLDVLTTDTFAEPAAVPAATSSLKDKINWLFTLARNKLTQTAGVQALRNDADSANIATSTVSDDGTTFTRNEFS